MIFVTGWVATILLTICAIPQLCKILKTKNVRDVSVKMWWAYFIGHLFAITYAYLIQQPPLLIKYGVNIIISIIIIIFYYKYVDNSHS